MLSSSVIGAVTGPVAKSAISECDAGPLPSAGSQRYTLVPSP